MSWAKLLGDRRVTALPVSKAELDNLRSIVARRLKDAAAANLSADAQFVMAYDAARTLSLMIVRSEGYRPRLAGGHYNTFLALEAADAPLFVDDPAGNRVEHHGALLTVLGLELVVTRKDRKFLSIPRGWPS